MTRASAARASRRRYLGVALCSAAALLLTLAAAAVGGVAPFAAAVGMSLVLGLGWSAAVGIRARYRHNVIILTSGILAALLSWLPQDMRLTWLPAVVAMALIAIFLAELVRGEGAERRLESTISSTAAVLSAVSASGWVALSHYLHSLGDTPVVVVIVPGAVTFAVISVAGARLLAASPARSPKRGVLSLAVLPVALLGPCALFASQLAGLVVI